MQALRDIEMLILLGLLKKVKIQHDVNAYLVQQIMQFFQTCLVLGSVVAGCTRARVLVCAVVTGRPVVARVAPALVQVYKWTASPFNISSD